MKDYCYFNLMMLMGMNISLEHFPCKKIMED
jgi:hypothetical protein